MTNLLIFFIPLGYVIFRWAEFLTSKASKKLIITEKIYYISCFLMLSLTTLFNDSWGEFVYLEYYENMGSKDADFVAAIINFFLWLGKIPSAFICLLIAIYFCFKLKEALRDNS